MQQILDFVAKSQDKIIVVHENKPFVIMPLSQYQDVIYSSVSLGDLTESEMLDKINRDIALWKSEQEITTESSDLLGNIELSRQISSDFESKPQIPVETKKRWEIPPERKEAAEDIIEEDRHYIEPIMF